MTREIRLPSDMTYPWHAIQLSDNQYAVVHGLGSRLNRLCIVNGEGTVLNSFGSTGGSGPNRLKLPFRLASFGGSLIVADFDNDRLMLFDANNLSVTGQLTVRDDQGYGPRRMTMNGDCSRIYVNVGIGRLQKIAFDWV